MNMVLSATIISIICLKGEFLLGLFVNKSDEGYDEVVRIGMEYLTIICFGNPLIKEEMELQTAIKDLKMEKSRYSEKIYELQDSIRVKIPAAISAAEIHVRCVSEDLNTARSAPTVITEEGKEIHPIKI